MSSTLKPWTHLEYSSDEYNGNFNVKALHVPWSKESRVYPVSGVFTQRRWNSWWSDAKWSCYCVTKLCQWWHVMMPLTLQWWNKCGNIIAWRHVMELCHDVSWAWKEYGHRHVPLILAMFLHSVRVRKLRGSCHFIRKYFSLPLLMKLVYRLHVVKVLFECFC